MRLAAGSRDSSACGPYRPMRSAEATEQAAQALAEEKRLTRTQSEAFERLKRAERRSVADDRPHAGSQPAPRRGSKAASTSALRRCAPYCPSFLRLSAYPVETLLATQSRSRMPVRGILVVKALPRQAEADSRALIADRESAGCDDERCR